MIVVSVSAAPARLRSVRSSASSEHRLQAGGVDGERVGAGAAGQGDADERLQVAPACGGVGEGGEPGDHLGRAQPPHAVGDHVGAQAHGDAEVAL
jgi:hypothetical protein